MAASRILIIDDDPTFRTVLRDYFQEHGLEVFEAGDAATGLQLAAEAKPDIVVSDITMPGFGSGLDALKCLRDSPATRSLPVIILSGSIGGPKLNTLAEPGRTWVLRKPPDWAELIKTVKSAIGVR
ncbi:MAG: response regulator [Elusimicrobia bacterium]|nr:response regulator [Elusimicrobiota bacterium]